MYRLSVSDAFFATMKIPVRFGRPIDDRDRSGGVRAAVVNETLARKAFPDGSPIGRRIRFTTRAGAPVYEIVGVSADARYSTLRRDIPPTAYVSLAENPPPGSITFYIRVDGDAAGFSGGLQNLMRDLDPDVPVFGLRSQEDQLARYLVQDRFFARLGILLGAAALLLACIGLYGLLSYSVLRRTPELGVRLALGAQPAGVAWMILRESMLPALGGIAVGLPASLVFGRVVGAELFGVRPGNPGIVMFSAALLTAVAAVAAYVPARRAARVDPMVALRTESS